MQSINQIEQSLNKEFGMIDEISYINTKKVLSAFQKSKIGLEHMYGSSGYGYSDVGKLKLNELFANIFNAEDAVVSPLITSGTHALGSSLMAILNSGDSVLSITGDLYDSLMSIVNKTNVGSLKDYNIIFNKVDLINGKFDYQNVLKALKQYNPKVCYIQRSCGYSNRDTFDINEIAEAINFVKNYNKNIIVFVDNCYGTFTKTTEPTDVGADIVVGSLIKNAGGGLAPTGGYIVGKKQLIQRVSYRLFGVGLGCEVGSYTPGYQNYFEGIFLAPNVVANALKGSMLIQEVLNQKQITSSPSGIPNDIIRRITFNDEQKMVDFIRLVQLCSPVDSHVVPYADEMPGYEDKVIMAAGGFVQGASIEMSADGPIKPPYTVYFQGGIIYNQVKILAEQILNKY